MAFLGIGAGKIDLQLNGTNFASGDKVEGTATLTLNQDIKAKGVIAEIWGEREETSRGMNGQLQRRKVIVYKMESNLDAERMYAKSESPKAYKFSFAAPDVGGGGQGGGGMVSKILGAFGSLGGTGPIIWFVGVKVDLQLAFDISKRQQISINSRAPAGAMH